MDVSVLITYHDEGALLNECLASLLSQTPLPREILVCDDASPNVPAIDVITDARVSVVRCPNNVGPSAARNELLKLAKCGYVHFHDADDWFEPGWSEAIAREIRESPDVVITEVSAVERLGTRDRVLGLLDSSEGSLLRLAIEGSLLVPSTTVRTTLARSIGGYDASLRQSEDYEFNLRLFSRATDVTVITQPLVKIRVHEGSRSQNRREVYADAVRALATASPGLNRDHWPFVAEAAASMASAAFRLGERPQARAGFRLARQLGGARFRSFRRSYAVIARLLGQEVAERGAALVRFFRRLLGASA